MALHMLRAALLLVMGGVEDAAVMLFCPMRKKVAVRCWAGVEDDEAVVWCDAGDAVWFDKVPCPGRSVNRLRHGGDEDEAERGVLSEEEVKDVRHV